jgi:hypothetical protein
LHQTGSSLIPCTYILLHCATFADFSHGAPYQAGTAAIAALQQVEAEENQSEGVCNKIEPVGEIGLKI